MRSWAAASRSGWNSWIQRGAPLHHRRRLRHTPRPRAEAQLVRCVALAAKPTLALVLIGDEDGSGRARHIGRNAALAARPALALVGAVVPPEIRAAALIRPLNDRATAVWAGWVRV